MESKNESVHTADIDHFKVDEDNYMYRKQDVKKSGDINSTEGLKSDKTLQLSDESGAYKVLRKFILIIA